MGFYESIDFSRESKRDGEPGVAIYAYMGHHQAMSLLALERCLAPGRDAPPFPRRRSRSARSNRFCLRESLTSNCRRTKCRQEWSPCAAPAGEEPAERTWKEDYRRSARSSARQRAYTPDGDQCPAPATAGGTIST